MADARDITTRPAETDADFRPDRRDFLKLVGGGIVVLFTVSAWPLPFADAQRGRPYPTDPNAYLRIGEDGKVTVFSGKIEMGQGVVTSLAQMAAEELRVPLDAVEMIMGDTSRCPWDEGTYGSLSVRFFGPPLRAAAAAAREILLDLASERLAAPRKELRAEDGFVFVASDRKRRVSYGELARGKEIAHEMTGEPELASPADFRVMGKAIPRRDAVEKATGKAVYAGDVRLPGMLRARILRPPAHGAELKSVDTTAAEKLPGVRVVRDGDLVAVLHADPEAAAAALQAVRADWDVPKPTVDENTIFDHLVKAAPEAREREMRGDLKRGEADAAFVVQERYLDGYAAHAPMETHTALAADRDGVMTVWASTQTPFRTRDGIAEAIGRPKDKVRVITPYVGGAFGGKTTGGQIREAVRLAQHTGLPVQVMWTREEEFFYDRFRPAAVVDVRAGVDADGKLCLWDYQVYYAGSRSSEQYYDVPNNRIRVSGGWMGGASSPHPFAVGPWRAPGANTNTFARESQIDALAARAETDPLAFRLANTSDPRMRCVLQAAADKFGWKPAAGPSGRGLGIACGIDAGTYVATIGQVAVDEKTGAVRVERLVCAQDMGIVVNPDGAEQQMEGCLTMGLGYALSETIRFKGGEILDTNFDTYELPRFSGLPRIETVLVSNDDVAPQGGGEPAIIGVGAVIGNAIFDATGARLRRMPMTPERVRAAIAAARG